MDRYSRHVKAPQEHKTPSNWRPFALKEAIKKAAEVLPSSTKFGDQVAGKILLLARWKTRARALADARGYSMSFRRPRLRHFRELTERAASVIGAGLEHHGMEPLVDMALRESNAAYDLRVAAAARDHQQELTPPDVIQQRVTFAMQGVHKWDVEASAAHGSGDASGSEGGDEAGDPNPDSDSGLNPGLNPGPSPSPGPVDGDGSDPSLTRRRAARPGLVRLVSQSEQLGSPDSSPRAASPRLSGAGKGPVGAARRGGGDGAAAGVGPEGEGRDGRGGGGSAGGGGTGAAGAAAPPVAGAAGAEAEVVSGSGEGSSTAEQPDRSSPAAGGDGAGGADPQQQAHRRRLRSRPRARASRLRVGRSPRDSGPRDPSAASGSEDTDLEARTPEPLPPVQPRAESRRRLYARATSSHTSIPGEEEPRTPAGRKSLAGATLRLGGVDACFVGGAGPLGPASTFSRTAQPPTPTQQPPETPPAHTPVMTPVTPLRATSAAVTAAAAAAAAPAGAASRAGSVKGLRGRLRTEQGPVAQPEDADEVADAVGRRAASFSVQRSRDAARGDPGGASLSLDATAPAPAATTVAADGQAAGDTLPPPPPPQAEPPKAGSGTLAAPRLPRLSDAVGITAGHGSHTVTSWDVLLTEPPAAPAAAPPLLPPLQPAPLPRPSWLPDPTAPPPPLMEAAPGVGANISGIANAPPVQQNALLALPLQGEALFSGLTPRGVGDRAAAAAEPAPLTPAGAGAVRGAPTAPSRVRWGQESRSLSVGRALFCTRCVGPLLYGGNNVVAAMYRGGGGAAAATAAAPAAAPPSPPRELAEPPSPPLAPKRRLAVMELTFGKGPIERRRRDASPPQTHLGAAADGSRGAPSPSMAALRSSAGALFGASPGLRGATGATGGAYSPSVWTRARFASSCGGAPPGGAGGADGPVGHLTGSVLASVDEALLRQASSGVADPVLAEAEAGLAAARGSPRVPALPVLRQGSGVGAEGPAAPPGQQRLRLRQLESEPLPRPEGVAGPRALDAQLSTSSASVPLLSVSTSIRLGLEDVLLSPSHSLPPMCAAPSTCSSSAPHCFPSPSSAPAASSPASLLPHPHQPAQQQPHAQRPQPHSSWRALGLPPPSASPSPPPPDEPITLGSGGGDRGGGAAAAACVTSCSLPGGADARPASWVHGAPRRLPSDASSVLAPLPPHAAPPAPGQPLQRSGSGQLYHAPCSSVSSQGSGSYRSSLAGAPGTQPQPWPGQGQPAPQVQAHAELRACATAPGESPQLQRQLLDAMRQGPGPLQAPQQAQPPMPLPRGPARVLASEWLGSAPGAAAAPQAGSKQHQRAQLRLQQLQERARAPPPQPPAGAPPPPAAAATTMTAAAAAFAAHGSFDAAAAQPCDGAASACVFGPFARAFDVLDAGVPSMPRPPGSEPPGAVAGAQAWRFHHHPPPQGALGPAEARPGRHGQKAEPQQQQRQQQQQARGPAAGVMGPGQGPADSCWGAVRPWTVGGGSEGGSSGCGQGGGDGVAAGGGSPRGSGGGSGARQVPLLGSQAAAVAALVAPPLPSSYPQDCASPPATKPSQPLAHPQRPRARQ